MRPYSVCDQHSTRNKTYLRASVFLKQTGETGQQSAGRIRHTEGLSHLLRRLSSMGQKAKFKAVPSTFSSASFCYLSSLNQLPVCWIRELQLTSHLLSRRLSSTNILTDCYTLLHLLRIWSLQAAANIALPSHSLSRNPWGRFCPDTSNNAG